MDKKIIQIYFSFLIIIINLISFIYSDINIHIIPHTHLDPGWLFTAEEYYTVESINDIFCTITDELYEDEKKEKTFVINELFYFRRWYKETSEDNHVKIKQLIKEKRIEFVLGGFVVNDEATPSYNDIIDQIRIGQQFLLEEFNITPKTAWYIDSFGHSAGNAYIMTQLNYENLILGRLHIDYLELLKKIIILNFIGNLLIILFLIKLFLYIFYLYTMVLIYIKQNLDLIISNLVMKYLNFYLFY